MISDVSEMDLGLLDKIIFNVFGSLPVYRSYGGLFLADGFILSVNNNCNNDELFLRTMISILALNLSVLAFLLFYYLSGP